MYATRGREALARALRHGLTQAAIAAQTDVSQPTVSGWIGGTVRPEAYQREALHRMLGIAPLAWFTPEERAQLRRVVRLSPRGPMRSRARKRCAHVDV